MKKAFYKNNAPVVYLFCIGWLGNVQRFITRVEPLYDSLNPLFCDVFAAVVACARSLLLWSKSLKNSKQTIIVSHTGKRLYHLPMEISGNSPRNFWSNGKRIWTRHSVSRQIIGQQIGKVIFGISTKTESSLDVVLAQVFI